MISLNIQFSSVQSLSHVQLLWSHVIQHTSLSCTTPTPGACSNSCPSSWWCHPTFCPPLLLLSSVSPSQHQGLFQWVSSWHQVAKVLELQPQHQPFQWILRVDFLLDWQVWSLYSPRDSQRSSSTPVQKHQFFGIQLSLWSNSHIYT